MSALHHINQALSLSISVWGRNWAPRVPNGIGYAAALFAGRMGQSLSGLDHSGSALMRDFCSLVACMELANEGTT